MFCVSNSFTQKRRHKTDSFFMLQAFSSSHAEKEKNVSLLLSLTTNCSPPWEQILSINENIKTVLKSISVQTFSLCQGLNPKFDKMSDFDLTFIQPVKT